VTPLEYFNLQNLSNHLKRAKFGQSLTPSTLIPIFIHCFAMTVIQILTLQVFIGNMFFAHTRNQHKDFVMIPICLVFLLEGSCLFLLLQIPSNSLIVSLFQCYPLSYLIVHSNWTCEIFHAHMKYKTITKNDSHHNDGSFFLTFHPMFKLILDFVSIIHDIVCAQSCYYWLKNNEIDV